jgi:hypothetical protein
MDASFYKSNQKVHTLIWGVPQYSELQITRREYDYSKKGDAIYVSGVLKKDELDEFRKTAKQSVQNGDNKILIILQDFGGWGGDSENWSDISLAEELDEHIHKMAVVGEPKWKNSVELFTLKGLRGFPIEYFFAGKEEAASPCLVTVRKSCFNNSPPN